MNKEQFLQKLSNIKVATSVTGVKYRHIKLIGANIEFIRENKSKPEMISIDELYKFYISGMPINTVTARSYISGRVQSPSVAILNEFDQILSPNHNNLGQAIPSKATTEKVVTKSDNKIKDETIFFAAFSELIGPHLLLSKSIGKPISSSHLFLSNDFRDYNFAESVLNCYTKLLKDLKSNNLFSSESLSHYVDGLVLNHPAIGRRIVEFDEEQHFTPARMDTLKRLSEILRAPYVTPYINICKDIVYLRTEVLTKHRLKSQVRQIPDNFSDFTDWLVASDEKTSGYICEKNGFKFLGGRIAQRAYYDSLRDTAHLSSKNPNMKAPLRFSKKEFEDISKTKFSKIPVATIKKIIIEHMHGKYSINLSSA